MDGGSDEVGERRINVLRVVRITQSIQEVDELILFHRRLMDNLRGAARGGIRRLEGSSRGRWWEMKSRSPPKKPEEEGEHTVHSSSFYSLLVCVSSPHHWTG